MPYRNVYFTGIVRDKIGRKMSKSLGNSPDPIELIDKYGADGVRMGMMLSAPAGNDILFDEALCEQGRNFCNKIWNAFRLIKGWKVSDDVDFETPDPSDLCTQWMREKMEYVTREVNDLFGKYRICEALMTIYNFFWDDFSSWYLEVIKPDYGQPIDRETYRSTIGFMNELLHLLHPFMPFITEELWQQLEPRQEGESLMTDVLPWVRKRDDYSLFEQMEEVRTIVAHVRNLRQQKNISPKERLSLLALNRNSDDSFNDSILIKMANVDIMDVKAKPDFIVSFMVNTTEYAVVLDDNIDVEAEIARMQAELKHKEGFLQGVMKKLGNEKFVANAPAAVLELERKKQADAESIIRSLKEGIAALQQQQQ
jgi:valyl-tRNA synthetase